MKAGISFVMPVLNEVHHLRDAVESVVRQEHEYDWELILAVGPSGDGTEKVVADLTREFARVRSIDSPSGRISSSLNLAVRQAKFPLIMRVDAHTELMPGYVAAALQVRDRIKPALLGGLMSAHGGTPFQQAVAWAYMSRLGLGGGQYHVGSKAREAGSAYLGVFSREIFDEVGGYDENIYRGEDWDFSQRVKSAGGKVWFSPTMRVRYWPRTSANQLGKQFYATGVWRGYLTSVNFSRSSPRYFIPPILVLAIVAGLIASFCGWIPGLLPLFCYIIFLVASIVIPRRVGLATRWRIPEVLAVMHCAWGVGFIAGLLRISRKTVDRSRVR